MATDTERLQVLIEGKVNDFEKAVKRVERQVAKMERSIQGDMKGVERSSARAAAAMQSDFEKANGAVIAKFGKLRGAISASLAGAVAGLSAEQFVSSVRDAISSVAELQAEAERAGLTFEQLQEIKIVADDQRVSLDALVDGFKELSLRADEFVATGKGPAADAFQRIGFDAERLAEALKDPQELFFTIIARLRELDRAAQIRVSDELFGGTGGEQFVQLLDLSVGRMRELIAEGRAAGRVLENDVGAKAAEIDAKFNAIADTVRRQFQGAVITAADAVVALNARLQETLDLLTTGIPFIDRLVQRLGTPGISQLTPITTIGQEVGRSLFGAGGEPTQATSSPLTLTVNAGPSRLPPRGLPVASGRKGKGSGSGADRAGDVIARLEEELALIGATDAARRVATETRAAGAKATESQRAEIERLVMAIDAETAKLDEAAAAQKRLKDATMAVGQAMADSLGDIATGAATAEQVVKRLIDQLIRMAIQWALVGGGPLGGSGLFGALSGLFAGGFAGGGTIPAGQFGIVGERGPEIVGATGAGARVISTAQTARMMGGAGGRAELTVRMADGLRADISGQMEGVAVRVVSDGLSAYDRQVAPRTAERIRNDPRRRG